MGIKTVKTKMNILSYIPLKNLPTTWGLRPVIKYEVCEIRFALKNLPTTWGLRQLSENW